ncbi:hypothetical protein DTO013E5_324 [Penicillium roqueforti]|uniref:NmrA-like n=1 Tax=Penicillium roqueforti (strain FM164) TaxID=1365484 RepID=W6QN09_PENRF|nr:uncharacterized protein LCP9604111_814 [Penicillium roqueforti]CDM31037.1 NmrA-like [Penicillium roqueforti FM164]KAF9253288.1 hypothetical protein LCP9604111_814 [Penicillium roqueforti]KAI1838804.1 hypothetical protein CBS147337_529 [Penicillium roqueforti]KAI2680311.1 hypothetical protein CBS147355_3291 [Penicillium roqueforti]KAI2691300.1 hypothetical protein LCP963914a_1501 [Penicillium roqueforti]
MQILVITCPSGKQCSHLIPLLYNESKFKLRLAAHTPESASRLQTTYPEAEVQICDTTCLAECRKLLSNATSVYHVGPSLHSREMEIGINMIDAAVAESQKPDTSFKHFVYSSVLGTQHRNLIQHDHKSRVEERLLLSPLNFTILQPTNFMDAYPAADLAKIESPSIKYAWNIFNPHVANSLVALRDLAEAGARVLNEREVHYFAQYPLCSTFPVSDVDFVDVIGDYIGKKIEVPTPTLEEGASKVLRLLYAGESGVYSGDHVVSDLRWPAAKGDLRPDITRDEAERLVLFYNRRGLKGNPRVLRWLIGREPTTVAEWVKIQLAG